MAKPLVDGSVFQDLPQSWEEYSSLHEQLNPQTISINSIFTTHKKRIGTHAALAETIGIKDTTLASALTGAPPLPPHSLRELHKALRKKGLTDDECRLISPEHHIQPKLLDYFVPGFATESDFLKRRFGGDSTNGYKGYAIAARRRCCELQAFIVHDFPSKLGQFPLHQHKGQEVLLCLDGSIEVYFWPISEPKRLTKDDVIYFDGSHPHQMISTTPGSRALSVISAPDGKSVEVSVQKFMGVFPHQRAEDVAGDSSPPRSVDSIDRGRFQIALRKSVGPATCSPGQQAMATIEIMKHPEWREIIKSLGTAGRGIKPQTISGLAAMNAALLNDLRRILGREDATAWTGEFSIEKIVRSARVDSLTGTGSKPYIRESHKDTWYQSSSGDPRVVQHPIFGEEELNDASVQMYPTVLYVNPTDSPNIPEGHVPIDQGVEFWFLLDGKLGMAWEDPNSLLRSARGTGELTERHSALLYETGLKHVPFVPPGQIGPTKCLHIYFTRSGGVASYRTRT